jgi:hypothetical protein
MQRLLCVCHVDLQGEFEAMLPKITQYLASVFRFVRCVSTRNDRIAEGVALCWKWFIRMKQQGKEPSEFVTTMARYAARAVRVGRTLCGQQKSKDVLSLTAKIKYGVSVVQFAAKVFPEHKERPAPVPDEAVIYEQHVSDDTQTPVPDQVAFRVDWPVFLETLTPRDRGIAAFLALGHQATEAAKEFSVSLPRISQVRKDWQRRWSEFHVDCLDAS